MKVGKTKDQGLYNEPSTAVHPGALAAGTLPQYNTSPFVRSLQSKKIKTATTKLTTLGNVDLEKSCRKEEEGQ